MALRFLEVLAPAHLEDAHFVAAAVGHYRRLDRRAGDTVKVGAPLVSGAKVKATVVSHGRGDKVKIFKMRRRKHYQKTQGHRQNYTEIRVDSIA